MPKLVSDLAHYRRTLAAKRIDEGWLNYLLTLWDFFVREGLATPHFAHELTKGDDVGFSRVWEMMLGRHLVTCGYAVTVPQPDGFPDFRCERLGKVVWVEATCATAGEDPALAPLAPGFGQTGYIPIDNILLRWTAARDEKMRKGKEYRACGVIGPDEAYVIAINGAAIGAGTWGFGVSRLPHVVEITMAVGPLQYSLSRETLELMDVRHQNRILVSNRNDKPVPTATFLRGDNPGLSALVGIGLSRVEQDLLPLLVIHNPFAAVSLPRGALGFDTREWVATLNRSDDDATHWDIVELERTI